MKDEFKTFVYIEHLRNNFYTKKGEEGVYYGFSYTGYEELPYELKNPKILSELKEKEIDAFFMSSYVNSFAITQKYFI